MRFHRPRRRSARGSGSGLAPDFVAAQDGLEKALLLRLGAVVKVWTSYARYADWCILIVRTDPGAPKHLGLTFAILDMKTPGITIRPLVEMTGVAWFNEVFFENVVIPLDMVVGKINRGWEIAITTRG